jgi:selenocysteine lyase/cysteine desulfurase
MPEPSLRRPLAGGGTVQFVSPYAQFYIDCVEAREEAGTPPIMGALRCGLAFGLRTNISAPVIRQLCSTAARALIASLRTNPNIVLLGSSCRAYHSYDRLPIISMLIKAPVLPGEEDKGQLLHHGYVCKLLNDLYGIQARSGCSCAGSYAHQLLGVNKEASAVMAQLATSGEACVKGGWTRVSFSLSTDPTEVEYTAAALHQVGRGPV